MITDLQGGHFDEKLVHLNKNWYSIAFNALEFFAFILPALPESLYVRLTILFVYFGLHYFKVQLMYLKFKNSLCKPKPNEEMQAEEIVLDTKTL